MGRGKGRGRGILPPTTTTTTLYCYLENPVQFTYQMWLFVFRSSCREEFWEKCALRPLKLLSKVLKKHLGSLPACNLTKNELFHSYLPKNLDRFSKQLFFQEHLLVTVYLLCLLIFAFVEILIFFSSFQLFYWKDITWDFFKMLLSPLVCGLPLWACSLQTGGICPIMIERWKISLYFPKKINKYIGK